MAKRFGENLARCREKADLSQEVVGLVASLHRTEVSQLERGLRVPRIDTLVKLAASLGVSNEDLLDGIKWNPGEVQRGGFDSRPDSEGQQ